MITKDSIETAYSFLHQKRRSTSGRLLPTGRKNIYIHSTLDWQKDDIELAESPTPKDKWKPENVSYNEFGGKTE